MLASKEKKLRKEQKVEHHDKLEQLISDKVQKMYEEETS